MLLMSFPPELLLHGALGAVGGDGRGVSQHEPGDPALGGGALLRGRPEHQEHVLLVAGQDLDHLALADADLILLHGHVVLGHQHGGYATAAAAFTLRHKGHQHGDNGQRKRTPKTRGQKSDFMSQVEPKGSRKQTNNNGRVAFTSHLMQSLQRGLE